MNKCVDMLTRRAVKSKINIKNLYKSETPYLIFLFVAFTIFVYIWYGVSLYRLYHLYSAVYDLGMSAERMWLPLHSSQTLSSIAYNIFYGSIIPYIFSPISLLKSLKALLLLQSVFIWLSVFPLYAIARKKNLSPFVSLLISISLFFYFPISGLNFFDFHMQAFFPFFFIMGYAFYVYEYRLCAFIFFIIAALTKFPFDIFVALFSIEEIVIFYVGKERVKSNKLPILPIVLFSLSTIFLITGELLSLAGPHNIAEFIHASSSSVFPLGTFMLTMFLIFGSVLFLPLHSKRWALFFVPFILLSLIANSSSYYFPSILKDQFSSLFIAFIFLGLIDVLSDIHMKEVHEYTVKTNKHKKLHITPTSRMIISIFIILILMSMAFQPWSPERKDNSYINYYYSNNSYRNQNTYTYLFEEGNLIPTNNPYVLVPNNIPEAYPRELICGEYRIGVLVTGFSTPVFKNITVSDAINNTFPYIAWNGTVVNIPIDYAWGVCPSAVTRANSGYQSQLDIMNIMLESGKYGIMAEANGTIVIERGYNGSPTLYVPMNNFFRPDIGSSRTKFAVVNNSYYFNNTRDGKVMWYGGTEYLPGTYNSTLQFNASKNFSGNISIVVCLNGNIAETKYINASIYHDMKYNVSFKQTFSEIEKNGYYHFIIRSNGFNGNISFDGILVKQLTPNYN